MERVLLRLVLALLKLLFQLVVFVATGAWPKLGKREAESKPAAGPAKPSRTPRKRAPAEPQRAQKPRHGPTTEEPWPFEFAAELSALERDVEGGRAGPALPASLAVRRARARLNVPALTSAHERRSLASAMRDRRTLRSALVLGAALAPRTPKRPPR